MLKALKQHLVEERPSSMESLDTQAELLFARKTYRYLRIAIVSMIFTLLLATVLHSLDAGAWLGSFSAYYFTPVHSIFVGSMIMTGVCLIAIRGTTDPEDIALNIAGLAAPVVALVPTSLPNEPGYLDLFKADALPLEAMQWNNLIALAGTAGFALVLVFAIGARGRVSNLRAMLSGLNGIGFALVALVVAGLIAAQVLGGSIWTHNGSAIVLIVGLWFVAMINSVRHIRDGSGVQQWGHQLKIGVTGSLVALGVTLAAVGLVRLISGEGFGILLAGLGVGVATLGGASAFGWPSPLSWFKAASSSSTGGQVYERLYLGVAIAMVVGAPAFGFWPGDFEHRTLWVELAELVPFGLFWIIQTVEKWEG